MMEFGTVKKIIQLMITIGLTIFDMVSDIILAVDYANTGEDDWWFALTLTFFLLPIIPLVFLLLLTLAIYIDDGCSFSSIKDTNKDVAKYFHLWKQFECVAESGPQLILQLYILAVSSMDFPATEQITDFENTTLTNMTSTMPETFTESLEGTINNSTVNVSVEVTTDPVNGISNLDEAFTLTLQILVIISALFSISWSSVTLKRVDDKEEGEDSTLLDYFLELVWNILCISSRVIALSLFASVQRYWFAGLITFQVVIVTLIFGLRTLDELDDCFNTFSFILLSIILGTNSVFNIFLPAEYYDRMPYVFYAFYWLLMMIENIVFITIWYTSTSGLGFWYHDPAIVYVIIAYFVSFMLKTIHTWIKDYNQNEDILDWEC